MSAAHETRPAPAGAGAALSFEPGGHLGRYRILCRLGRGGAAELHLGQQEMLGSKHIVAIKRLRPDLACDPEYIRAFGVEAEIAELLRHPNIPRTFEAGAAGAEQYIIMQFLHGHDLGAVLRRVKQLGGSVPLGTSLHVALAMCSALHYAHELLDTHGRSLGIVHRDVSPANVFVTFAGDVKLLDFGVALSTRSTTHTSAGTRKGTVPYMSPEQCMGQPLDRRSDVYGLGVVLYELTTGRRPHTGRSDAECMQSIVLRPPARPDADDTRYPAPLADVVMRALERDPDQRFPTAAAFEQELLETVTRLGIVLAPDEPRGLMEFLFCDYVRGWRAALARGLSAGEYLSELAAAEAGASAGDRRGRPGAGLQTVDTLPLSSISDDHAPLDVPGARDRDRTQPPSRPERDADRTEPAIPRALLRGTALEPRTEASWPPVAAPVPGTVAEAARDLVRATARFGRAVARRARGRPVLAASLTISAVVVLAFGYRLRVARVDRGALRDPQPVAMSIVSAPPVVGVPAAERAEPVPGAAAQRGPASIPWSEAPPIERAEAPPPGVPSHSAAKATLKVEAAPPCTAVVDAITRGATPLRLRLRAGRHEVACVDGGSRVSYRETIRLRAGDSLTVRLVAPVDSRMR